MRLLRKNMQPMKYSLQDGRAPIYETDIDGNIIYYEDSEENKKPLETGEYETGYSSPVDFMGNINNKLAEVLIKNFGIDDSTNYAQIVVEKDALPIKNGSVIWKKSEVKYKDESKTIVDEKSADYLVKGVADEGQSEDLYLLQRIVK